LASVKKARKIRLGAELFTQNKAKIEARSGKKEVMNHTAG
jgi:hypothetical protein